VLSWQESGIICRIFKENIPKIYTGPHFPQITKPHNKQQPLPYMQDITYVKPLQNEYSRCVFLLAINRGFKIPNGQGTSKQGSKADW
jgi:hypothetical protein